MRFPLIFLLFTNICSAQSAERLFFLNIRLFPNLKNPEENTIVFFRAVRKSALVL